MYIFTTLRIFFDELLQRYRDFFTKNFWSAFVVSVYGGLLTAVLYLIVPGQDVLRAKGDFFKVYFYNSSRGDTYVYTDFSMMFFMAIIALWAIALHKSRNSNNNEPSSFFIKKLKANDVFNVVLALVFACIIDFGLSYLYNFQFTAKPVPFAVVWLKRIIYYIEAYTPSVLFAFAVSASAVSSSRLWARQIVVPLVIVSVLVRAISIYFYAIFDNLILFLPNLFIGEKDTVFIINIFLCLPFLAFYVPGYTALMRLPALIIENEDAYITEEDDDAETDTGLREIDTMDPYGR